jgi:hypothetical protein
MMLSAARILIFLGLVLLVLGGLFYVLGRAGVTLGRLPGDVRIQRGNLTCVIALGTSILLSIALTVILNLLARIVRK